MTIFWCGFDLFFRGLSSPLIRLNTFYSKMLIQITQEVFTMKRFLSEPKKQVLTEAKELGNVSAVARRHGISNVTIHNWIKKSDRLKLKKLDQELADQTLENQILKELLKHKWRLTWRLKVTKEFTGPGYCLSRVLQIRKFPRSTQYHRQTSKPVAIPQKRGWPVPEYTANPNGTIVIDA